MKNMNLRLEMGRRNVRQLDIAELLGCTAGTVSKKINGEYPFTLNEAVEIKKFLKYENSLESLFEI